MSVVQLYRIIVYYFLMSKDSFDSFMNMWDHRIWEIHETLPYHLIMQSRFEIIRHTTPSIYEIDIRCFLSIDIVCMDDDITDNISFSDTHTDFFRGFADGTLECIFSCFYLSSWDRPV